MQSPINSLTCLLNAIAKESASCVSKVECLKKKNSYRFF